MNSQVLLPRRFVDLDASTSATSSLKSATIASSTVEVLAPARAAAAGARRDARVALAREPLRVGGEQVARVERAAEPRRVEALDRAVEAAIGLDAAAAVHLAAAVGVLQILGLVRLVRILSRSV